uniref:Uncharacterized protein n=1 Tax=Anguilla anguilla TaxID=7936 RepID=A0A0E9T9S7_ANGAN
MGLYSYVDTNDNMLCALSERVIISIIFNEGHHRCERSDACHNFCQT